MDAALVGTQSNSWAIGATHTRGMELARKAHGYETTQTHPDYETMSDEVLMRAVGGGDRRALEQVYDRHMSGCYGLAMKIVRDPSVAEEIVQDVFLKLWTAPQSYVAERGKFSGWLLTLVHNRSVDRLRRARSNGQANALPLDLENDNGIAVGDSLFDGGPTPYEAAWHAEESAIVRRALNLLPAAQREAITLAYYGGLTQKEIAERLGAPLGTIKTRTRSGLMHLRRVLGQPGLMGEAA